MDTLRTETLCFTSRAPDTPVQMPANGYSRWLGSSFDGYSWILLDTPSCLAFHWMSQNDTIWLGPENFDPIHPGVFFYLKNIARSLGRWSVEKHGGRALFALFCCCLVYLSTFGGGIVYASCTLYCVTIATFVWCNLLCNLLTNCHALTCS